MLESCWFLAKEYALLAASCGVRRVRVEGLPPGASKLRV